MAFSMAWPQVAVQVGSGEERARGMLAGFRDELYWCLGKRRDALFELADAVLCKQDRVHMLAELSLEPECRRGHGALYDAVNAGRVQVARLRRALAAVPLPAWPDGRIRLAADVSNWLRPPVAAVQYDARDDGTGEQPDGRGAEGEYRPGYGERIRWRGHELEPTGLGRAQQAGHAEVDHGGQQPTEREAERRDERGEVSAQVGTGAGSGFAGPAGQGPDRDRQRDEQGGLHNQQDGQEPGQAGSAPCWRPCSRWVQPLANAETASAASAAISTPLHYRSALLARGEPVSGSLPPGSPRLTTLTV